jgi:hypothetical protein
LRGFGFNLALLIVACGLEARAGTPAAPVETPTEIAEKAARAFDLGHYQEAIEGFSRAYELSGKSSLLFDIAEAHRALGQSATAIRMYENYLRRDPNAQRRELTERRIRELESGHGPKLNEQPPPTSLGPAPIAPPPRSAAVVVRPAPRSAAVVVRPAPPPAAVVVKPAPPPAAVVVKPAPRPAVVVVKPAPPLAPALPPPAPEPPPSVSPPSFTPAPTSVDIEAKASPGGSSASPVHDWIPWTLAGVTVALAAGAVAYGLSASNRYDSLNTSCGQTPTGCSSDQVQEVKSRALKANVLWALAGVAAIGTGVVIYADTRDAGISALWTF